ncbi:MAG: arylsulfatase [Microvirga sp.]|nr:arylsulfatase [Microvirga sp.]
MLGLTLQCLSSPAALAANGDDSRPNIVLILADDLGYSDIGAFGGEIDTPNLDALAGAGLKMTNFHVSPACSPTRAMLMSGANNHKAGLGNMAELVTPPEKGKPGYEGYLSHNVTPFPELLRAAGYDTYMVGKWHLGLTEELSPAARGFEKSYAMLQGGAGFFDQTGNAPTPDGKGKTRARYRENRDPVDLPTRPDFYTTDFFTDKMIEYIGSGRTDGHPFFSYVAYTAPHFPLQAPDRLIDKYKDRYLAGYEVIRKTRFERMKEMGLIPSDMELEDGHPAWPRWEQLTPQQKENEARRMAVYAGMVESMDQNIGKLVSHLKQIGEFENTILVFLSDNGAEANDIHDLVPRDWVAANFNNSLDNLGRPGSYIGYGPGWGQVSATPFRLYKGFPSEGGTRSPTIIFHSELARRGKTDTQLASVLDLAPTFLQVAGIDPAAREYADRKIHQLEGTSLWSYLSGGTDRVHPQDQVMGLELFGRAYMRKGDWKLVWINRPWGSGDWELYNLAEDPHESRNLSKENPQKFSELMESWKQYQEKNGVIFDGTIAALIQYTNSQRYYDDLVQ